MAYTAKITEVTPVGSQIRIDATMFEDGVEPRPMPTVTVTVESSDVAQMVEQAVALIKTELQKFKDSRSLEALLQGYVDKEVTL